MSPFAKHAVVILPFVFGFSLTESHGIGDKTVVHVMLALELGDLRMTSNTVFEGVKSKNLLNFLDCLCMWSFDYPAWIIAREAGVAQHRFAEWEKVFHQAVEADLAHLGDSFSITSLPPKSANKVRKVSTKMKKPSGAKAILGKRRPASKRPAASQKFNPKKQRKTKNPMNFYKKYKYVVEIDESHLNKQRSGALAKSARIQPDQVWVWGATVPGQPDRFVFRVLEHAKDAYDGKPRGQNEILQCLRILNLKPKTILVTDGWKATIAAVKQLKLEMKWTDADLWHEIVNHSAGEITNANGFTTNHIENRWSLVKRWARKRGVCRLPSHSDRKRWTCLLNEYRWRKLQASRKAQGNKHVYVVPLTATLNALQRL